MKKKLSLMLCLIFMILGLVACGSDVASADYFGLSYEELQTNMEDVVSTLGDMSEEDKAYIGAYGADSLQKLVTSWNDITEGLGTYTGLGKFSVSKAQDTLTLKQNARFSEREVCVTYVYAYNYETKQIELIDVSAELLYSLSETMGRAGMNTLMGMGTVFAVLILISLIIYGFRVIPYLQKKKESKLGHGTDEVETFLVQEAMKDESPMDDLVLAAVISAAIAASTEMSPDSFVVRSIRRR